MVTHRRLQMSWFDNGFHFAVVCALAGIAFSPLFAVFVGHFIHEGMGPDGQEGGAK